MKYQFTSKFTPGLTEIVLGSDLIVEVRGILPELDKYVESFTKAFSKKWNGTEADWSLSDAEMYLGNIKPFYNKLSVVVSTIKGTNTSITGEYDAFPDPLRDGKFDVQIRLKLTYVPGMEKLALVKLKADFAHELTHAYEDLCRANHGATTMGSEKFTGRYDRYSEPENVQKDTNNSVGQTIARAVRDMYYFMDSVERNAFVASLRYELVSPVKEKLVESPEQLFQYAMSSNTEVGKNYINLNSLYIFFFENWMKAKKCFDINTDELNYEKLNREFNELLGKNRSLGDNVIQIQKDWISFSRIFKTRVGKIVSDVWNNFK